MAKAPAIKNKEIHYEYVDGVEIVVIGSDTIAIRQKLYDVASKPVVTPPVVVPPIIVPPVIVPPSGSTREMTLKELSEIKGGLSPAENIKIKPIQTSEGFGLSDIRANIDLSQVLFKGNKNVALNFYGDCSGIKLFGAQAVDCNELINYDVRDRIYNGKEGSFIDGFTIEGFNLDRSGQLFSTRAGGFQSNGTISGVIKGFKLLNSVIKNHPDLGQVIWAGYMENALISGNVMDNLNFKSNNHNGIFSIWGLNGRITGNKLTNHQGDLLRAIPAQLASGKGLEIDNNLVARSRWYSAIELQAHEVFTNPAFKPIESKIHHNTAVSLSLEKTREGQLFDEYNLGGGSVELDYNLGANLFTFSDKGITNMINENFKNKRTIGNNNKYFTNESDAVNSDFSSKFTGIGAKL